MFEILPIVIFLIILLVFVVEGFNSFLKGNYFRFWFILFGILYFSVRPLMIFFEFYHAFRPLDHDISDINKKSYYINVMYIHVIFGFFYLLVSKKISILDMQIRKPFLGEKREIKKAEFISLLVSVCVLWFWVPYISFILVMAFFVVYHKKILSWLVFILVAVSFLYVSDNRRDFISLFLLMILMFSIYMDKFKLKKLLFFTVLVGISFSIYFVISMRNDSLTELANIDQNLIVQVIEIETDFSIVNDDLNYLVDQVVKEPLEHINFNMMIKGLVFFIPRDLWANKPETSTREFAKLYSKSFYENGGSKPVTFIGESLISFGPVFFIGLFLVYLVISFCTHSLIMSFALFLMIPSIIRGPFEYYFFVIICYMAYRFLYNIIDLASSLNKRL